MRGGKIRRVVEVVAAVFLLALQNMPAIGPWVSLMFVPLGYYLILYFVLHPEYLEHNLLLLLSPRARLGQMIAVAGFIIFIIACVQFLRRRGRLVLTGLYSVVRHPQYLGIIVTTLGASIICVQLQPYVGASYIWLVEVFGYVLLAHFEERQLLKEHGGEYEQYRGKVPFIFPMPSPAKIPEALFSMILALIIVFICMFL